MKTNRIYTFAILMAVCVLSSCKYLEPENKSTVTADEHFSTESGWNQLLNQAYYELRTVYSNPVLFCAGTDMYTVSQGGGKSPLHVYSYNADNADVQTLYTSAYASIKYANCVLKYSSNETLNDEARFARNLGYYVLTQQFGSIPYITEYIETASNNYPRTPLADIYNGMITELEAVIAAGRLPQNSYMVDATAKDGAGHASILACKALLAKVCLAAGWDLNTTLTDALAGTYTVNGTSYFDKAAKHADEVATAVPLIPDFEEKWNFDVNEAGRNTENLFAIQYDRATSSDQSTGGHSMQHYFGGYMGSQTIGVKALKNDLCPTERVHYAFEKGDDRYEGSFMTTIYGYDGDESNWAKKSYWAYWNTTEAERNNMVISWKFFPWYTDQADIESYIAAHASQFVTTGYKQATKVLWVADQVKCWAFKADGSSDDAASSGNTMKFDAAIAKIGLLPPVKKFDDKATDPTVGQSKGDYRDIILLDASEIYLTGAEAYLLAGKSGDAVRLVNKVRERAHATTLGALSDYQRFDYAADPAAYVGVGGQDAFGVTMTELDVILDERMRETLGELNRWMDLRRTKQLVRYNVNYGGLTVDQMTGVGGNIKWLRPIPTNEMQINTGITEQTPGF